MLLLFLGNTVHVILLAQYIRTNISFYVYVKCVQLVALPCERLDTRLPIAVCHPSVAPLHLFLLSYGVRPLETTGGRTRDKVKQSEHSEVAIATSSREP